MVAPLRHRPTKGAATDMPGLLPPRHIPTLPAWAACALSALSDRLTAEGERRLLWLPVFFGAGIGFYFALRVEPPLWPWVAAAIAGAGLSLAGSRARARPDRSAFPPAPAHP